MVTVKKSRMVEILSQKGVEDFKLGFYVPSDKSGATIGNGIDLAAQNREKLQKLGAPTSLLEKLDMLKLYGLRGDKARKVIRLGKKSGVRLTESDVVQLSNIVTQDSTAQVGKSIGKAWESMPEGIKAVATSLYHVYDRKWFKHDSFKQLVAGDYRSLKANMQDYGDKTEGLAEGVNNRHKIMSYYIPE